jgi:nucleoid DNA-binding protein
MTKSQLVTALSEKLEMSKKDVSAFLDALVDTAYKETKKEDSFTFPGFGKLVKQNAKPPVWEETRLPVKR